MASHVKSEGTAVDKLAAEPVDYQSIMDDMEEALEKVNKQRKLWIVAIFLLTSSPGIFNAYHIMVSVFITVDPPHWCRVPQLESANWTRDQIKNISKPDAVENSCTMIGWNFTELAMMGYDEAKDFVVKTKPKPKPIPCAEFNFDEEKSPYSSVVQEWNLVCNNKGRKSHVQGSIAVGKLIGGFIFGFLADKYGRKFGFNIACLTYVVSGTVAALAQHFWFYLVLRFFIGVAGAGVYETGFTILAELIGKGLRPSLGCMYSLSYPVGYITLPAIAYFIPQWRFLQLAISLPMLVFLLHFWFLPESPRWLLTQGKFTKAWNIIKKIDRSVVPQFSEEEFQTERRSRQSVNVQPSSLSLFNRLFSKEAQKIYLLFTSRETCKRLFITAYANFAAALTYYVLGLNAINFGFNKHLYMFLSGLVEVPGYLSPLLFLLWVGRKLTSFMLYFINALFLLLILVIPKSEDKLLLTVTMMGRFTDVAMFALIILYTSELFPTTVRNAAVGSSLAVSQFGSISAPYIIDYSQSYGWTVPTTVCGLVVLLSAALILLLPETRGRRFLDTIEQLKREEDKVTVRNCCKCS